MDAEFAKALQLIQAVFPKTNRQVQGLWARSTLGDVSALAQRVRQARKASRELRAKLSKNFGRWQYRIDVADVVSYRSFQDGTWRLLGQVDDIMADPERYGLT